MAKITIDGQEIDITGTDFAKQLEQLNSQGRLTADGLRDMNSRAGASSSILEKMGEVATGTAKSVVDMASSVYSGTATLSTGFSALNKNLGSSGLSGAVLGAAESLIKEGEAYLGTFRQLSQTGGGLNGDLFELKNSAAQSRLTLDQFASVVTKNADNLAALGGTVSQGTRIFTQMSKEFFDGTNGLDGFATRLTNMGMTTEDINDQLALMGEIQQRQNLADQEVRRRTAESAVRLATEMDAVAKLTGKQKEQIEEEMMASMRKGQVEAKFRKIEMEQGAEAAAAARAAYAEAMTSAQKAGPDAVAALEETFVLGGVRSEQARRGIVALGPAADAAQATFRAIADAPLATDVSNMVTNMDAALVQRINSAEFLDTAMLASAGNQYGQAAATMLENAGQFETAISRFMSEGMSYADAVRAAREQVQAEQEGRRRPGEDRTVGADTGRFIANAELQLKNLGAVINDELIGENGKIQAFANELKTAADFVSTGFNRQDMQNMIGPVFDEVGRQLGVDPAPPGPEEPRQLPEDQAEAEQELTRIVKNIADSTELNAEQSQVAKLIMNSLLSDLESAPVTASLQAGAEAAGMDMATFLERIITGGNVDNIVKEIAEATGKTEQVIDRRLEGLEQIPLSDMVADMEQVNANTVILNAENVIENNGGRRGGSLGAVGKLIEDFGEGTRMTLHGKEGVITAEQLSNMAAGVSNIINNVRPRMEQAGIDVTPIVTAVNDLQGGMEKNINDMLSKIASSDNSDVMDTLNNSLKELTNLNSQQLDTAKRQVKRIAGLGSDVFRSLG